MLDHRMKQRAKLDYAPIVYDRRTGKVIGKLNDVSAEGIQLLCEEEPVSGGVRELGMRLPYEICGLTVMQLDAEMMWCRMSPSSNIYTCGFRLHHLTDDESEALTQLTRDYID